MMKNKMLSQMKLYISRKLVRVPNELYDDKYTVKMVETEQEYFEALRLLHNSYLNKGLMHKDPRGIRLTDHHLLPETNIMIVKSDDLIIGTGTIVHEHQFKFPSHKIYASEIDKIIKEKHDVIELSSLAVHPDFRKKNNIIQILISKYYVHFVNKLYSKPYHICSTHPKAAFFYKLLFNFQQTGDIVCYDFVNNAKAAFIHGPIGFTDLAKLKYDFNGDDETNFMSFFCSEDSRFQFPAINPALLVSISWVTELIKNIYPALLENSDQLTADQHQIISQVHSLFNIHDDRVMHFINKSRSYRLKSRVKNYNEGFSVVNISDSGALLLVEDFKILDELQKGVSFKCVSGNLSDELFGQISRIRPVKDGMLVAIAFRKSSEIISLIKSQIEMQYKKIA